jgi:alginate export protein
VCSCSATCCTPIFISARTRVPSHSCRARSRTGAAGDRAPWTRTSRIFIRPSRTSRLGIGGTLALTLRAGRQEMAYGSARLIDVRQGPNVRRSFDAARMLLHAGGWQVDGFAARPVLNGGGVFDSRRDPNQALWSVYGSGKPSGLRGAALDLYYLGFQDDQGDYVQGTASETRHSVGGRLWGKAGGWDYNFESLFQWGHFGSAEIRAWTAASDTGHTWNDAPLQPRLGLRANVASGDDDPNDDVLETFNPLYPRGNYFNELATLGPRNFFDVHPFLTVKPHERFGGDRRLGLFLAPESQ